MKKRIGTKLYDTDKGIPVLPEKGLYKQPMKRSFYLFDGEKIEPVEYDQAEQMIRGAGNADLMQFLEAKPNYRGVNQISIDADHYKRLMAYSRKTGVSCKKLVEQFIDSLSEA